MRGDAPLAPTACGVLRYPPCGDTPQRPALQVFLCGFLTNREIRAIMKLERETRDGSPSMVKTYRLRGSRHYGRNGGYFFSPLKI